MGHVSMRSSKEALLSVQEISKSFHSQNGSLNVLKNISFDIDRGEFVSILGPSGCGKSTLLKICSSIIQQDSGTVSISGVSVQTPDKNRILMLQDDNQLFPWLTVEKNVAFAIRTSDSIRKESDVTYLLDMAGLSDFSNYYPHQLSGGMKKRTALARALAGNPEILLMDEPFGSLDAKIKIKLQDFLLDIWKKYKLTILFVTHDIHEAIQLGERIMVVNEVGEIICDEKNSLNRMNQSSEDELFKLYRKYYKMLTTVDLPIPV